MLLKREFVSNVFSSGIRAGLYCDRPIGDVSIFSQSSKCLLAREWG
jgi:hypothetical protein